MVRVQRRRLCCATKRKREAVMTSSLQLVGRQYMALSLRLLSTRIRRSHTVACGMRSFRVFGPLSAGCVCVVVRAERRRLCCAARGKREIALISPFHFAGRQGTTLSLFAYYRSAFNACTRWPAAYDECQRTQPCSNGIIAGFVSPAMALHECTSPHRPQNICPCCVV